MHAALQESGSFLKKTATWESPHTPPEITLTGPFFSALTQCQQMEGQLGSLSLAPTNAIAPLYAQINNSLLHASFCHVCAHMVRTGQDPMVGGGSWSQSQQPSRWLGQQHRHKPGGGSVSHTSIPGSHGDLTSTTSLLLPNCWRARVASRWG